MGWIDFAWPMIGAASLTLGVVFLLAWVRQTSRYGYAMFFLTTLSVAAFSIFELRMMRAATPEEYAVTLRWAHIPLFTLLVSVVGFVRLYFGAGRAWLGYSACALRAASLGLNFHSAVNLNFQQVTAMLPVSVWGGETIYLPVGLPNPDAIVAQISNLLFLCFLADATITLWRRGGTSARRHTAVVGTLFLSLLTTAAFAALLNLGLVRLPTVLSIAFLAVVVAVAYELGWEVVDAARLAERLRASDERLRESEQRLQLAAGAGALGLWEWNLATDQVWMTRQGRALLGFRADETVDLARFLERVHPDDRAVVERGVRSSLEGEGHNFEQEFRVVLPDGHVRWVTSRGRIERDATGAACRIRGASQDVTARTLAEERFRTLVEATSSAMLLVDAEGVIVLANGRAESMFGYAREELVGHVIEMIVPADVRPAHVALRRAYSRAPQPRGMAVGRELLARRKDASTLPVEVGLNPLQTSEGAFVLASVVDVSARKAAELEAARQREEIAHLARVAMLGELSGSLAHELNQPLAAILSNAQAGQRFLARDPPEVDEVKRILQDIVKSDKRAGQVITRLRSLFKKEETQHAPVDVNDLVQEVLALMRSDLLSRQVKVSTELANELPLVSGDRVQLQQVLLNLLANACDAMAHMPAPRCLLVRSRRASSGEVVVEVADNGTGIAPENMERIFEHFVSTKPQGMGLGLAICRSIVKAHGGRLWATNMPEGGATLTLQLPVIDI